MVLWRQLIKSCGTLCLIMIDLSGTVLFMIYTKFPDAAYQHVLDEFDLVWRNKGYIVKRSNLLVTWKVRPLMGIIACFPLVLGRFYEFAILGGLGMKDVSL